MSSRPTIAAPRASAPRWVLAALALITALLLFETIVRLEGLAVCADAIDTMLEADAEVGWTYAKGRTFALEACTPMALREKRSQTVEPVEASGVEGWRASVTVNRAGLVDQEWPEEKRPGEVRVLLLGNHTADGIGVARSDRLSVRLMHLADRVRGARVSVINATVEGYATREQQRWLENAGLRYHPDLVVLLLDPARDVQAASHPVRPLKAQVPLPPASGLLDLSAAARWATRGGAPPVHPPVLFAEPARLRTATGRQASVQRLVPLVASMAETARNAGAKFAVVIAPPCPPPAHPAVDLCKTLEHVAPCTDLGPTFAEMTGDAAPAAEMCLDGFARWGRDAHFLASLRVWDLLQSAGLWPASVVRGYRL